MSPRPEPRLVVVTWKDSRQPSTAWRFLSDIKAPAAVQCMTAGWLVAESPEAIGIATSLGDVHDADVQASGVTQIPRICISKIADLAPEGSPADGKVLEQALRDPENQPSQWGTVPAPEEAPTDTHKATYWCRCNNAPAELGACCDHMEIVSKAAYQRIAADLAAARAALKTFGTHTAACRYRCGHDCDCGLTDLIAAGPAPTPQTTAIPPFPLSASEAIEALRAAANLSPADSEAQRVTVALRLASHAQALLDDLCTNRHARRLTWAIVRAAGGRIAVAHHHIYDSDKGTLHQHEEPNGCLVYRATVEGDAP